MSKLDQLFSQYEQAHRNRYNRLCHFIGIPLILIALVGFLVSGLNAFNVVLFFVGWAFQFLGHAIEGTWPEFLKNPIFLIVGVLYFAKKIKRLLFKSV
jgi:uncharacterized membrane protein YGL010W